jgi:hypothetical protein
MFFHQRFIPGLAIASYMVGDEKARQVTVIDPTRDVTDVGRRPGRDARAGVIAGGVAGTRGADEGLAGPSKAPATPERRSLPHFKAMLHFGHLPGWSDTTSGWCGQE